MLPIPDAAKYIVLAKYSGDTLALYAYYYCLREWQNSDVVQITNFEIQADLDWTSSRLIRAKKELLELGAISIEWVRTEKGAYKACLTHLHIISRGDAS